MANNAIEVKDLCFSYGTKQVLDNISLNLKEGKITTILGPNGCGKTILFHLLTKILKGQKGNIYLNQVLIENISLKEFSKKVAIVQQTNSASDDVKVETIVGYGRTPYIKLFSSYKEEDKKIIDWAMEVTGVKEYKDREIGSLSGGQRQRVWIAMALAQNTKILFLDEPTTYLDVRYQLEILELIKKLNKEYGITIIMVLHDINQSIAYSDYLIGLKDGHVKLEGEPNQVITQEIISDLYGILLDVVAIDGNKHVLMYRR